MEQDRGGGGVGGRGRGVEIKGSGLQPHHPPPTQPQKCPRCDSSNTKFCYYNNYSLSQPRYFCKTCRRYWTQGGTLRNVPVGGGCRKGKRLKRSSSPSPSTDNLLISSNSSAQTASIGHLRSKGGDIGITTSPLVPILQPSMYYPGSGVGGGGGFFSSLAAFQSLDQTLNIGGGGGGEFGGSSLALLQGFGLPFHTQQMHHQQQMQHQHQHQHQQQEQEQFYLEQSHNLNMGSTSDEEKVRHSSSHQEWSNPISSETADYWNNSNTTNNNHNNDIGVNTTSTSLGVSLNPPPHWMDNLPDFASPPALPASPPPPSPLAVTPNTSSPPSFL